MIDWFMASFLSYTGKAENLREVPREAAHGSPQQDSLRLRGPQDQGRDHAIIKKIFSEL